MCYSQEEWGETQGAPEKKADSTVGLARSVPPSHQSPQAHFCSPGLPSASLLWAVRSSLHVLAVGPGRQKWGRADSGVTGKLCDKCLCSCCLADSPSEPFCTRPPVSQGSGAGLLTCHGVHIAPRFMEQALYLPGQLISGKGLSTPQSQRG